DADELLQELDLAHRGVTRAIAQNAEWTTPRGSCFAAAPLGPRGGVAFVYPGGISAYPGLGRDLYRLFPAAQDWLATVAPDLAQIAGDRRLFPRSQQRPTPEQFRAFEAALADDAFAVVAAGSSFAY